MTPTQMKFIALEKKKDEVKKYYEDLKNVLEEIARENGVNSYFQDAEGTVYKIVEPAGKFVTYDKISYVRTRRLHEERGDLSLKEAKAAGFLVTEKA